MTGRAVSLRSGLFPAAALMAAACAATPLPPAKPPALALLSTPYEIDAEGRPVIDVTIDGRLNAQFIIDTASTRSAVDSAALSRLDNAPLPMAPVRIIGITGAASAPTAVVGSLEIDIERFDDLRVVILDDWRSRAAKPQGIIGLDILARYLVVFDPRRRLVQFYDPAAPPAEILAGWNRAPLSRIPFEESVREELSGLVYALQGRVNLRAAPMLIDSGSSATVANRAFLQTVQVLKETMRRQAPDESAENTQKVRGVTGASVEVLELIAYGISAGDISWRDRSVFILDAPIFGDLGFADDPFAIIGFDTLGDRPFAIDFRNDVFYVAPVE